MRKIILYDMNYFYAQVEERDNPELKGKAIAVAPNPENRGSVILTCNYKARERGVRSGMPGMKGRELCRDLIYIYPRMKVYYGIHKEIREVVEEYSDRIEYVALDEGYIDVTNTEWLFGGADNIAIEIQKKIFSKTKLTCSIGVGYNKMTAKLAAEKIKPNGYFNLDTKEKFFEEMKDRSVRDIPGIGGKISLRLNMMGIFTVGELREANPFRLKEEFKSVMAKWLEAVAEGYDEREVAAYYKEKSMGRSVTLMKNTKETAVLKNTLIDISKQLSYKLKKKEEYATKIALKLRWADDYTSSLKTRELHKGINRPEEIFLAALDLLEAAKINRDLRGIGISVAGFVKHRYTQLRLGEENRDEKLKRVEDLTYMLREKYGYNVVFDGKVEGQKAKGDDGKELKNLYLR